MAKVSETNLHERIKRFIKRKYAEGDQLYWNPPDPTFSNYSDWIEKQVNPVRYEKIYGGIVSWLEKRIKIKSATILDNGCGMGRVSILFAKACGNVVGLDIDDERVEIASMNKKLRNAKLEIVCGDGVILPFPNNTFDLVVSVDVTEHVSDTMAYLRECVRVLKPQGTFYCTFKNKFYWYDSHYELYFVTWLPRQLADLYVRLVRKRKFLLHYFRYGEIVEMMANLNLRISEIIGETRIKERIRDPQVLVKILTWLYLLFTPNFSIICKKIELKKIH